MLEIERKFLVDSIKFLDAHRPMDLVSFDISQGYLNQDPNRTVRVRLSDDRAYLTIKGKSSENGLSRFEWETEINFQHAKELLKLCTGVVNKTRYHVNLHGKLWEIDVFQDVNEGLVIAEIELTSETESFNMPEWVTEEVTGDPKYYNSNLGINPFKWWIK